MNTRRPEPFKLLTDTVKEKDCVLACRSRVHGDVTVAIPEETLALSAPKKTGSKE